MMGWATLRHGGLPAPVLLIALALCGAPFLLPRGLFLPAAPLAVAGCAALATAGLPHPPGSPPSTRMLTGGPARAPPGLAVSPAVGGGGGRAGPPARGLARPPPPPPPPPPGGARPAPGRGSPPPGRAPPPPPQRTSPRTMAPSSS